MARQRKCSLAVLRQIASEHGGKCLSRTYRGYLEDYLFCCSEGHRFKATAEAVVLLKHWCHLCRFGKFDVAALKRLASGHEGRVRFLIYEGADVPHPFVCKRGHEFELKPALLAKGHWCPECKLVERRELLVACIASREGELLTPGYVRSDQTVLVRCRVGHEFEASVANLLRKTKARWCPMCSGGRKTCRTELGQIALAHGGELLESRYRGYRQLHTFRCGQDHEFQLTAEQVCQGCWCSSCEEK